MSTRSSLRAAPVDESTSLSQTGRVVRVTLPSGQRAELWVPGGLVTARAVRRVAREATRALERRARALESFGTRVAADQERLSRAQRRSLGRQLRAALKGDSELDERIARSRVESRREWEAQFAEALALTRRLEKKTLVHPATLLSSLPLFSIFGRHNLQHHLTLVVVLAIWLFGDEVTDLLSSEHSETSSSRSNLWLYSSPAANLLAGWWLLHERQHEPFVTGTASEFERVGAPRHERKDARPLRSAFERARSVLAPCVAVRSRPPRYFERYRAVVELAPYVARDFELDLVGLTEPPALATVGAVAWSELARKRDARVEGVAARVELGKLYISLTVSAERGGRGAPALLEQAEVAWVVKVLDEANLMRST